MNEIFRNRRIRQAGIVVLCVFVLLISVAATTNTVSAHPGPSNYHTIQKGETLYSIAQLYGLTVADLMQVNPQITDPDVIYAGTELFIPGQMPGGPGTGGQCRLHHYVQWGETLSEIALHYKVPGHVIMKANGIQNPDLIYAETYLCIP